MNVAGQSRQHRRVTGPVLTALCDKSNVTAAPRAESRFPNRLRTTYAPLISQSRRAKKLCAASR